MSLFKVKNIKAVITYESGRKEELLSQIKANGGHPKAFKDKIDMLRSLKSVVDIKISKY